ncbi:hypothetical protein [Chromobacterium phragmitis]|uniref:hypothetical protein n=1 Tax=Chromobacterium phragmitis TaxID=2202141 RepID=UPI0032655BC7
MKNIHTDWMHAMEQSELKIGEKPAPLARLLQQQGQKPEAMMNIIAGLPPRPRRGKFSPQTLLLSLGALLFASLAMLAWHQAISIASLAMTLWAGRLALASRRQDSEKAGILHRLETAKALFEREQQVRQELLSRNAVRAQDAWEQLKNLNSPANLRSHRACNLEIDVEEELSEHDLNLFFGSLSQAQNDTCLE